MRALPLLVAFLLLAPAARAADEGRGGEIVGSWTVTSDALTEGHYTLQIDRDGSTTIKYHNKSNGGESNSTASGPTCTQANGKLKFNGSADVNHFKVAGTWTLTWEGPDALTAKSDDGKTYKLARVKEK